MIELKSYDRTNRRYTLRPLVAFEAIRRILGHATTVSRDELEQMLNQGWETGLLDYAARLRALKIEQSDDQRPNSVLPIVDAANLRVSHSTCTGGTSFEVATDWNPAAWLTIHRERPFNLNSGRDLAIALLGMAAIPSDTNWAAPGFWEQARNAPGDDAVFGAFLSLRDAAFSDDEVVALMAPAGLVPDPETISQTVLGWAEVEDFDRRLWLYRHAALFGDMRDWIPLPA